MQIGQSIILALAAVLALGVLAGLVVRGLLARCLAFGGYLLAICVATALVIEWPGMFLRRGPFLAMEVTHDVLRHLVALELAFHTFRAFPAARRKLRLFVWAMTAFALAAPFVVPTELLDWYAVTLVVRPRMLYAALLLFTGLGALVLWYRLPLDTMHKAVLMGFVPYLLVRILLLNVLADFGVVHLDVANFINTSAWIVTAAFWAYVAWRPRTAGREGLAA